MVTGWMVQQEPGRGCPRPWRLARSWSGRAGVLLGLQLFRENKAQTATEAQVCHSGDSDEPLPRHTELLGREPF